jgi:hypothetical protein
MDEAASFCFRAAGWVELGEAGWQNVLSDRIGRPLGHWPQRGSGGAGDAIRDSLPGLGTRSRLLTGQVRASGAPLQQFSPVRCNRYHLVRLEPRQPLCRFGPFDYSGRFGHDAVLDRCGQMVAGGLSARTKLWQSAPSTKSAGMKSNVTDSTGCPAAPRRHMRHRRGADIL